MHTVIESRSTTKHLPALDGIRGVAILSVMLIHMFVLVPKSQIQHFFYNITLIGWVGVDLFFVLSGFLITNILLKTRQNKYYFKQFYIRRVARIFPLFYGLTILSFIVIPITGLLPENKSSRFDTVGSDQIYYWFFLSNFAIAKVGMFRHGIMDVTWSLAIEEQFYLFWPLIVWYFPKRIIPLCIGLIAFSVLGRVIADGIGISRNSIYVLTFFRFDGLAMGAILAALWQRRYDIPKLEIVLRRLTIVGGLGLGACVFAGGTADYYLSAWMITLGIFFASLGFMGCVGVALHSRPGDVSHRLLTMRPLRFLGMLSYCLYLIHLPIRAFIRDRILTPEWINTTPLDGMSGQLLFYALTISVCCAVAWISYHLIEKRAIAMGHRLTGHQRSVPADCRT